MKTVSYYVPGMSCEHCKRAITMALKDIEGVNNVNIDLEEKKVVIEYDETSVQTEKLIEAIEDAGYDIE